MRRGVVGGGEVERGWGRMGYKGELGGRGGAG